MREAVAFILVRDGSFLVERRSRTKELDPGTLAIPGGHVEEGEGPEEALRREMVEELRVTPLAYVPVSLQVHESLYPIEIRYYLVTSWEGEMEAWEADELSWLPLMEWGRLDLEADRAAIIDCLDREGDRPGGG